MTKRTPKAIKRAPDGPWQPSPTHLEWYRLWTKEMWGPSKIAENSVPKVSRQAVHEAVNKVAEWYRHLCHSEIMNFRDRQTHIFEQMIEEAWEAWRNSIGEVIVTTDRNGEHPSIETKTSVSQGNPAYLAQVVSACQEIQKLWGFNAPAKQQFDVRHSEDIPGFPSAGGFGSRSEAFEHAMNILKQGQERAKLMEIQASAN